MKISDQEYREIQIVTEEDELIVSITDEDVIEKELEQFRDLVEAINFFGMVVPKK